MNDTIYMDHNATTPVAPEVRDAMLPWLGEAWGNPSCDHAFGRRAAAAVAQGRAQVAALIGGTPQEVIFTGGGTEADNLALRGPQPARRRIVVSAVEHPAVALPAAWLERAGWSRAVLPVDRSGVVDEGRAAEILATPAGIVSVMLAQNETGAIQPVQRLAAMARAAAPDVVVHTDAAQAAGKIAVDVGTLGVDLATVVSHKLYGPAGIAALWNRGRRTLQPMCVGGGQEGGARPGTEPVALIVGFGAACALAQRDLAQEAARVRGLVERLWAALRGAVPTVTRTVADGPTLPNTLHVCFEGKLGAALLHAAPQLAASTGSACHADDDSPSGVLGAMGMSVVQARGAVRLSLGRGTTEAEVDRAARALIAAASAGD